MTDEPTPSAGEPSPTSWSLGDQAIRRLLSALFRLGPDEPATTEPTNPRSEGPTTTEDARLFGATGDELAARPLRELGEGMQLGRFRLERELGRGGFGVVYLAVDESLGRKVALKTPRPDRLQNAELWRRFAREARLAAALDHPAIVPVLEAGAIDDVAFIASAYQEGCSLSQWIRAARRGFPPRMAATIAEQLADGLTHAHQRGVLHRDLKPGNVIMIGDRPRDDGGFATGAEVQARITDFGLGSFHEAEDATLTGVGMGSPPYMAPEQVLGGRPVDVRTDIYALGAILYEMLTGRPIHPKRTITDLAIRLSRGDAPTRPRRFCRKISRDLETICLKCLAHDPAKRYGSASELLGDLRRHLDGRPIAARRAPAPERFVRWARRHPSRAALAGVLVVGAAVGQTLVIRHHTELSASHARLENLNQSLQTALREVNERDERLEREVHAADLASAQAELAAGDVESAQWILSRYLPKPDEPDRRGFVWRYLWGQATRDYFVHDLNSPAWGPLDDSADTEPNWWRRAFPFARLDKESGFFVTPPGLSQVDYGWWSLEPNNPLRAAWDGPPPVGESLVALSNDGRTLVFSDQAWIFDPDAGPPPLDRRKAVPALGAPLEVIRLPASERLRLSADGRTLASLTVSPDGESCVPLVYDLAADRAVALFRLRRRRALVGNPPHTGGYRLRPQLAVSPHGRRLAIGLGDDSPLQVTDANDGRALWSAPAEVPESDFIITSMAFSPDGSRLVAGDIAGRTRLWDAETGRAIATAPFLTARVEVVGFHPDADTVVTVVFHENRARSWPLGPQIEPPPSFDHGAEVWGITFIPGSNLLATGGDDHLVRLWDVVQRKKVATLETADTMVTSLSASADGRLLAVSDMAGRLWVFEPSSPKKPGRRLPDFPGRVRKIAFSPDGRSLAIVGRDHKARIWDRPTGRITEFETPHDTDAFATAWSPDGATLAIGGHDEQISLWRKPYLNPLKVIDAGQRITCVAFSPDGETLVAANAAGGLQSWRLDRLDEPPSKIKRNSQIGGLWGLTFSPDGRVIAAGDDGGNVSFWDPATLREICRIREHQTNKVHALAFSPDGRQLATADFDGRIIVHTGAGVDDDR